MGSQHFADLNNNETISYKLATLDNRTAKYADGGYLQNINNNVINYNEYFEYFEMNEDENKTTIFVGCH